jgi:quinol monooxygenase YgiN
MMTQICLVVEFSIADGKVETFKKLLRKAIDVTRQKDLGALNYQFYFNKDATKCYSIEWYQDSDAVLRHLDSVAEVAGSLFEVCATTRFEIFGNPSTILLDAFKASSPNTYTPWDGFSRK